jgi:hypothetical protein
MHYAWVKSGVAGSCLATLCSVSGTCPTGCRPCTAHGLNQVLQVPVWLCHVALVCRTGCRPCSAHGLNQVLQVPVWLCHVVLVGHVPQVAEHALRMA